MKFVQIEEMLILLFDLRQRFAARASYAPRISQHFGKINAGIERLDVSQPTTNHLFGAGVALRPEEEAAFVR